MPFGRVQPPGLVYTIDLSKVPADMADRRTMTLPFAGSAAYEKTVIEWGDGDSDVVNANSSSWPSHEYASDAGNVFKVIVRSAAGHFPTVRLKAAASDNIGYPVELACVSFDHYYGWMGGYSGTVTLYAAYRVCSNLKYLHPRLFAPNNYSMGYFLKGATALEMPLESFCFDFVPQCNSFLLFFQGCTGLTGAIPSGLFDSCTAVTSFNQTFYQCANISGAIPSGFFDNNTENTSFYGVFAYCANLEGTIPATFADGHTKLATIRYCFYNCAKLTGSPYAFWGANGQVDSTKFPALATAAASDSRSIESAYSGCASAMRAQVPAAFGGSMSV